MLRQILVSLSRGMEDSDCAGPVMPAVHVSPSSMLEDLPVAEVLEAGVSPNVRRPRGEADCGAAVSGTHGRLEASSRF